jgi:hypothetical protein
MYIQLLLLTDELHLNKSDHAKEIRKLFDVVPSSALKFENLKGIQGSSDEEVEKIMSKSARLYK